MRLQAHHAAARATTVTPASQISIKRHEAQSASLA